MPTMNMDVKLINKQLEDLYGRDTCLDLPLWRVVWSEDQFEKRLGTYDDYSPSGIYLRTVTEVRLVPKYRQWITEKYVLENLCVIPYQNKDELPQSKVSYEPIFVFEDKDGNFLPPKLEVAKFVIDCIYAARGKTSLAPYKDDPVSDAEKRVQEIQEFLYGDNSYVTDKLRFKEGVFIPDRSKSQ